MRKRYFFVLALLVVVSGCTVYDALFGVFGSAYSGGGFTEHDKSEHYNAAVSEYKNRAD